MRKKIFTFLLALMTSVGLSWAAVDGKLPGVFSVSADKAVSFSKGNLQYTKSTGKWSFMEHQYDVVETYEQNVGNDYADQDVVGLFGWGTSGNSESGTNYQPYCTSTTNVDYVSYLTEAGEWTASKSDWGVVNSGDLGEGWRVMTKDEWCYLLGWTSAKRDNASNLRTFATVNGMKGLILMPDGWTASGVSLTVTTSNFTTNNINTTDWATLEEQGCVFLPAAGCRNGSPLVNSVGFWGYYWYSTAESSIDVYRLGFSSEGLRPINYFPRNYGLSVRLVTETTPPGSDEPEEEGDVIILQTNTQQSSYTQSTVTITCDNVGDNDGFTIGTPSGYTATITNSVSSTISKIVLVPGYYKSNHPYVRANGAQPTSSSNDLITFTNVNSNSVTLSMSTTNNFQIKEVRVTLVGGGSTPTPANVCGDGLTWELNGGVLTISYDGEGTGEMTDFDYENESPVIVAPWKENKSEITTVIVGDGVKSIGNYAFNDLSENFTAVTIANSVERIGVFAFTNSEEITAITLPSSLKTIDDRGFANCGFTSITIPSGVTSIGYQAFSWCRNLKSLTCEATTPPTLDEGVFYKITSKTSDMSNIPLYVPSGSVAAYEAAAQWSAFDIQGYDPAPTPTTENSITINGTSHGSVVASSSSAAAGETITLTATPDEGYQLKSISGVYEAQGPLSETLNATSETVNGNKFQAQATSCNLRGWRVYNPGTANTLTVSSLNGTTLIEKIEFTSTWGASRTNNMLSVSKGTLSFDGSDPSTTVTINDINATSVTISGSGNNAGTTWCISSVKIYYTGTIEKELEISDTENANVKTFTMVDSEVTISAEFEPAPEPEPQGQIISGGQDPQNTTYYYSTFFDSQVSYLLPAGVEAYVATISDNALTLTKIAVAGQTIPANNAVIFRANAENFTLTVSDAAPVSFTATNSLRGVDAETTVTDIAGLTANNCYVLSGGSEDESVTGVGFYRIFGSTLLAHKAYVQYSATSGAPKRMRFVFPQEQMPTGIDETNTADKAQKVMENGTLYIIREGVRYNAAGQRAQ